MSCVGTVDTADSSTANHRWSSRLANVPSDYHAAIAAMIAGDAGQVLDTPRDLSDEDAVAASIARRRAGAAGVALARMVSGYRLANGASERQGAASSCTMGM